MCRYDDTMKSRIVQSDYHDRYNSINVFRSYLNNTFLLSLFRTRVSLPATYEA